MSSPRVLFAVDTSGSVQDSTPYWSIVKQVLHRYRSRYSPDQLLYVSWSHLASFLSLHSLERYIDQRIGSGGTEPDTLLKLLQTLPAQSYELCLLTDGEVNQSSVDHCDHLIQQGNLVFTRVECHIIHHSPSLSVSCPFTRQNEVKVVTYTPSSIAQSAAGVVQLHLTPEDWTLLHTIETVTLDTFLSRFDTLQTLLIAKHMGRQGDPVLKDTFIALKKRLVREMSDRNSSSNDYSAALAQALEARDLPSALRVSQSMVTQFYQANPIAELTRKLDTLVGLCGNLQHQFRREELATQAARRADIVSPEQPVTHTASTEVEFECPILMEQDCPCIMIHTVDSCVLMGEDKSTIEFIIDCPLRLLLFPELVSKTKAAIAQCIGVQSIYPLYQQSDHPSRFTNPYTRQEVSGVIALGHHSSHLKATDYALYQLFTKGKRLGHADMWLAVVYLISKDLVYLREIQDHFRSHLHYRWDWCTTFASLSGNGALINTSISVKTALWFVVSCSILDPTLLPSKTNPVRFHSPEIRFIVDLVEEFWGSESVSPLMRRAIETMQLVSKLLKYSKKSALHHQWLQEIAQGLWRAGELVTIGSYLEPFSTAPMTHFVTSDWSCPFPSQVTRIRQLLETETASADRKGIKETFCTYSSYSDLELYQLLLSIHPSKSDGDTTLDLRITFPSLDTTKGRDWSYLYRKNPTTAEEAESAASTMVQFDYEVPICYATFRPYSSYYDTERMMQTTWSQSACYRFRVQSETQLFPGTKYFLTFLTTYRRVPTEEEYLWFCDKRLRLRSRSLPLNLRVIFQWICNDYKACFQRAKAEGLKLSEIIQRIEQSTILEKRKELEREFSSSSC